MDVSARETSTNPGTGAQQDVPTRKATILAWSFWALVMICCMISFVLRTWNMIPLIQTVQGAQFLQEVLYWGILTPLTAPAFGTVGAIIASRRPQNTVGWLCLALGFIVALQDAAWQYGSRAVEIARGSLPAGPLVAMIGNILVVLQSPLPYILLLLVFPSGRFLSPRWRLLAWIAVVASILEVLITLTYPLIHAGLNATVSNPIGINSLQAVYDSGSTFLPWFLNMVLLVAVFSIIVRWRRAKDQERQQLKWVVYIGIITVVATIIGSIGPILSLSPYIPVLIGAIGVTGASVGIPIAIGIAILKYRLYDIDRLINGTLVYGTLTVLLGLVYFGIVIVLQFLVHFFTGQVLQSPVVIVASTLAIATLFNPLRYRVQSLIDRRFYRRKYDAVRTLEAFSATLRNEVDLDQLREQLLAVVQETMQPAHVSLWISQPGSKGKSLLQISNSSNQETRDIKQNVGDGM